jgi:uncharacterized membrane protein
LSEYLSWKSQGIFRSWWFVIIFTTITFTWLAVPVWFHDPGRLWLNYYLSYLAVLVESIIGIGVASQSMRDAVILREIKKLGKQDTEHSVADYKVDVEALQLIKEIHAKLTKDN